ncbi:uncharacterized protein SOCE26_010510 [Sorangium cellulosum]|uniref:Fungal lipase-type domain-containing protein n=1 Tax=Sorangium cellulosum TaxID=56 RepID=A0A2L0EK29_SORCE|nr:lipase family protein [Sorangium cellulosum]AUX39656.1 uncharacterized protein SOCE26_010510 [Sorangium cellulosum]
MLIEGIFSAGLGQGGARSEDLERRYPSAFARLARTQAGEYDREIAKVLAFTSTWTYSNVRTFAGVMARRGLLGAHAASLAMANDALLVNTSAFLVQSPDRKVAILSFRGTEPRNAINWLTDASTRMSPLPTAGRVHGGFYHAVRAMWEPLKHLLKGLHAGRDLCQQLGELERQWVTPCPGGARAAGHGEGSPAQGDVAALEDGGGLEALYITGHSLGAALAVIAAVLIEWDDDLADLRQAVRGVYTYGQPMVGDRTFALEYENTVGKRLFRHVYGRDIVPRMPPFTIGGYVHLGRQYNSGDTGWEYEPKPVRQAITVGLSNTLGVAAWLTQQISPISWLRLPFSWGDHMPINYLRASMTAAPGTELD